MNNGGNIFSALRRCSYLTLPIVALCLIGCGSQDDRTVEETVEQSYKVDPTARFSIRNTDGSIRIYGADIAEIKLQAVKTAYSRERLEKIVINVAAQPASVAIDTLYPPKPKLGLADRSGTVDYTLIIPRSCIISRLELANGEVLVEGMRGSAVQANLVNGHLIDHNCFGEHHLFVANGMLDVAYDWWEKTKFSVDATIVNGNASAFIPGDASFHLLATTATGSISNEFSEQQDRHGGPVQKVDAMVGAHPQAEIKIQATSGTIKIAEVNP